MDTNDEALQVLLIVRRRLLERMATVVVANRATLLNGSSKTNNPLAVSHDLVEITQSLNELDNAIAGLADMGNGLFPLDVEPLPAAEHAEQPVALFDKFIELVSKDQLEAASRELSRVLCMPLDRVVTATRFFSRASKNDPSMIDQLKSLRSEVQNLNEADGVRLIMKTFGFQAVESIMAMRSLQQIGVLERPQAAPHLITTGGAGH